MSPAAVARSQVAIRSRIACSSFMSFSRCHFIAIEITFNRPCTSAMPTTRMTCRPSRRRNMDRETIRKSQAKVISSALFPGMNYLYRLRERMQKVGFPHDDKLYLLVSNAYDAMHRLSVAVHYLSCD